MSNVKAGDLAVIIRARHPENIGGIVTVIEPFKWARELTWLVEGRGPGCICLDADLRPIRPQADDAECNSAAWLPPVPTKEVA